jgi:hypothetical protein
MYFGTLKEFLEFYIEKGNRKSKNGKSRNSTGPVFSPRSHG